MTLNNHNLIGIFSYFGFQLPLDERLRLIKDAGFEATALWWGDEIAFRDADKDEIPKIVRDYGLVIDNIHVPYENSNDLWSESELVRKAIVDRCISWLNDCAEHKIPRMVMHISKGSELPEPNMYGIESMKRILKVAEELNVIVAVENTRRNDYLNLIFSEIHSKSLGFCYDSSHDWLYSMEKAELLKRLGEKLATIHLSDNDGIKDRHWVPKSGIVDWNKIIKALMDANYTGCLFLEVYPDGRDCDLTPQEFLRKVFEQGLWIKERMKR